MDDLIREYYEALAEVTKYNKSLKWCLNFFDEDDETVLDVKEALRYAIIDFKHVVAKMIESNFDIADLILIGEGVDNETIEGAKWNHFNNNSL